MFKKLFTLTFIAFIIFFNNAQKLSVEKIWKNYEFFGNSINGFKSMKDGKRKNGGGGGVRGEVSELPLDRDLF